MKKVSILAVAMLMAFMPLSFADYSACNDVNSSSYLRASGAKLVRGVGNVALSWVEFFRQPIINENKWEGVGQGVVQTGVRAIAGAVEAVTFFIPGVHIPQPNPPCPTDLANVEHSQTATAKA